MATVTDTNILRKSNFRLCRLCTWSNYDGFGFILDITSHPPCLISCVQSNSPAAAGGLKIRDTLLAINNQDVSEANYKHVTDIIKHAMDDNHGVDLLVIEQRFYKYLKRKQICFDRKLAEILETPRTMPSDYLSFPAHTPRTCEMHLSEVDQSFGFEIVEGENEIGLYIQEVDSHLPADRTSLRKSDRILEIDDQFVNDRPSKEIVTKLCQARTKRAVKLYVVDTDTYNYFQENNIPLSSKKYLQSSLAKKLSVNSYTNRHDSLC